MAYRRTLFSYGFKVHAQQPKYVFYTRAPRFRVIVFKGGGGRTWVYKKFLHVLDEHKLLDDVKEYGGSSAGALFAVLAAMPLKYKEREKIIDDLKFHKDILDHSLAAYIYRIITFPLYLITLPLQWLYQSATFLTEKCYQFTGGFLLAFPLNIIRLLSYLACSLTHPNFLAGTYNLFTKGGIYLGNELHDYIRESLYKGTLLCIKRAVRKNPAMLEALKKLEDLVIIHEDSIRLKTKDITFAHFHALSNIEGLGFKDVFLTATRYTQTTAGRLAVFNHSNAPDRPIHQAVRMSMSVPFIYKRVIDNNIEYIDGGCANNFPIQYASKREYKNAFEEKYFRGIHGQDLDVLGVRVEYEKDLGILHEPVHVMTNGWQRFIDNILEKLYNFVCGMDIYTPENELRTVIRNQYPLRVLQLYDHGVGFTEVDIEQNRKNKIMACEEERIQNFLKAHQAELTHVKNYDSLHAMGIKRQKRFLDFLKDASIPNEEIFDLSFSEEEASQRRKDLIQTLSEPAGIELKM